MKTRFIHYWELLRSSYWVIPAVMMVAFAMLSEVLYGLDEAYGERLMRSFPWLVKGGVEGSRNILSTTASSVLTIAGVTFSVTMVTLTLASSQFGPRLLRQFIRSLPSQLTLAILVNTSLYCLLVLRNLRDSEDGVGLPISTLVGLLFVVLSLGMFIYFVHHVAMSIQGERIVARVHQELEEAIVRYFPSREKMKQGVMEAPLADITDPEAWEVLSPTDGYLQAVELEHLITLAKKHSMVCRLMVAPGEFVTREAVLFIVRDRRRDRDLAKSLSDCVHLGPSRTPEQDYQYAMRLLVEVALRAMSPGINDPFTAIHCIDCLGAAFAKIIQRPMPRMRLRDSNDIVRVELPPTTFETIAEGVFAPLRRIAYQNPDVAMSLLKVLEVMARVAKGAEREDWVWRQAEAIQRGVMSGLVIPEDGFGIVHQMEAIEAIVKDRGNLEVS